MKEVNSCSRQEYRLSRGETLLIEVKSASPLDQKSHQLVCKSVDISANGIKAEIDQPLPLNAYLSLFVETSKPTRKFNLAGQVKWIRPSNDGRYHVGFEILESYDTDIAHWKKQMASWLSSSLE